MGPEKTTLLSRDKLILQTFLQLLKTTVVLDYRHFSKLRWSPLDSFIRGAIRVRRRFSMRKVSYYTLDFIIIYFLISSP